MWHSNLDFLWILIPSRRGVWVKKTNTWSTWSLRASPTVLQISFAFMYLQKNLKNTYPTVWHLDFAILLTWQKERKDCHICQTCSHLALENWREVINVKPLEIAFFQLCHIFLDLANSLICQTNYAKRLGMLLAPQSLLDIFGGAPPTLYPPRSDILYLTFTWASRVSSLSSLSSSSSYVVLLQAGATDSGWALSRWAKARGKAAPARLDPVVVGGVHGQSSQWGGGCARRRGGSCMVVEEEACMVVEASAPRWGPTACGVDGGGGAAEHEEDRDGWGQRCLYKLPESTSLPSVKGFAECYFGHSAMKLFAECWKNTQQRGFFAECKKTLGKIISNRILKP